MLKGGIAAVAASAIVPGFAGSIFGGDAIAGGAQSSLTFSELKRVYDQTHHVAPGYNAEVLLRWGDKLAADAPAFDAAAQTGGRSPGNSDTTMISSATCRCPWVRTAPTMACSASITNIPIRM